MSDFANKVFRLFSVACIFSPRAAELPDHPGEGGEGAHAAGGAALRCLQGEVATGSGSS